ncbi:hypothetical protein [Streptomyces soliscabiei]|uniref:hypothetical protein n=1 Tax=Streptomyces soliscabiei TaxID=588897 RepID=UPI0029A40D91|nr:hypothetical protein [Streptomyces sp. NY05-11A]MDX2682257.1 hypothetical protein [Streptomyces sp. NY05-11A]
MGRVTDHGVPIEPIERRVDTLLWAETDEGAYLLVVESQGKPDDRERGSWPYYLAYLREKYRCEPVLIVVTQSRATARWAAEPMHVGVPTRPSMTVWPFVLGPENVPLIATEREARQDPPLAVLSAMTHGRGRQAPAILESLEAALRTMDRETAAVLAQFVDSCLGDAQERADVILRTLKWREVDAPDAVRERVLASADLEELATWLDRAYQVTDAHDLFRESS